MKKLNLVKGSKDRLTITSEAIESVVVEIKKLQRDRWGIPMDMVMYTNLRYNQMSLEMVLEIETKLFLNSKKVS